MLHRGRSAYGIKQEPLKIEPALAKIEGKPELALAGREAGDGCVPLYVFLRKKAMGMSPEDKRELMNALLRMAEEKKINVGQLIRAIQMGDCEYHEVLERV